MPKLLDRKPPWRFWCGPTTGCRRPDGEEGEEEERQGPAKGYLSLRVGWHDECGGARDREGCWADAAVGGIVVSRTGEPMATFWGPEVSSSRGGEAQKPCWNRTKDPELEKKATACDDHRLGASEGRPECRVVEGV
jgi:hypothetical protein